MRVYSRLVTSDMILPNAYLTDTFFRISLTKICGSGLKLYSIVSWIQSYLSFGIWSMGRFRSEIGQWQFYRCARAQYLASSTILVKMSTFRSASSHGPNFNKKVAPCSAHWALKYKTWSKRRCTLIYRRRQMTLSYWRIDGLQYLFWPVCGEQACALFFLNGLSCINFQLKRSGIS